VRVFLAEGINLSSLDLKACKKKAFLKNKLKLQELKRPGGDFGNLMRKRLR
jgi:hypothetical protein